MENQGAKILYVEDDETLSYVTKDNLELKGYQVDYCSDGKEALEQFNAREYDLCILDVMLPKLDGFTLAKKIREANQQVPIIFLSAKSTHEDKIYGLRTGADDYITKPFTIQELVLKIEVFLKRRNILPNNGLTSFRVGNYHVDVVNLILENAGFKKNLTPKEARLLKFFMDNQGKVLKREDILITIWGKDDYFMGRSLDVFISRLRKYLKNDPTLSIENIHSVGFKFNIKE